jgi:hypothetical protein
MNVPALADSIKGFESSLDSLEHWLVFWIACVVIGLILEVFPEIFEAIRGRQVRWHSRMTIGGGILITLGVAGELFVEVRASAVETKLRNANANIVASLNKEAGDARSMAGEADERAALAERQAGLANERAADANLRAEKEAGARVAMLAQLKPRDFSKQQMDAFVSTIKGKVKTLNVFTLPDPEAALYGFQVLEALKRAGVDIRWYSTGSGYFLVEGVGSSGLTLYESPERDAGPVMMAAFEKAGQPMSWFTPERQLANVPSPSLFIALKQPPLLSFPGYMSPPELLKRRPPWDPK